MKKRRETNVPTGKTTLRRAQPPVYPFTAIVAQEEMKLALLLNVIDPSIGGVLIMGHRGTGKSTAVRALADLLPRSARVRGCLYGCDPLDRGNLCDGCSAQAATDGKLPRESGPVPVVDLPLGATEDRVCGTIDIERALREGIKAFEPGLLARANRGFLYIDEVNLLEDHLIDLLLDVAATGRNVVEREGVSIEHPARFVLVGSGNPEEGELRPQLIDRFGLHVEVKTVTDLDERVRIVEQREAFERGPSRFHSSVENEQETVRRRLVRARKDVEAVKLSRQLLRRIAELCQQLKIDGHRGELTIARAARALAAFERRKEASVADVRRVATMALRHRMRRDPLEQTSGGTRIEQSVDRLFPPESGGKKKSQSTQDHGNDPSPRTSRTGGRSRSDDSGNGFGEDPEGMENGGVARNAPLTLNAHLRDDSFESTSSIQRKQGVSPSSARVSKGLRRTATNMRRGRYSGVETIKRPGGRIALDATLRAGAQLAVGSAKLAVGSSTLEDTSKTPIRLLRQRSIRNRERGANRELPTALRYKRFKSKVGTLFIFVIDTSGSMALNRIAQAKGALVQLLRRSYVKRDRVALVSFRGNDAEVLLPPSGSVMRARRLLDSLSIGGATPLGAGLASALEIAERAARLGTERVVVLVFTDGRANVSLRTDRVNDQPTRRRLIESELQHLGATAQQARIEMVVVDTRDRFYLSGEGSRLAETIGARYIRLETIAGSAGLLRADERKLAGISLDD